MGTTTQVQSDGTAIRLTIDDTATAIGTAAVKDIPTSGDASTSQVVYGTDTRLTNARTPAAHKTSHQDGGSDEVSVAGLSGLLADAQTPLSHTHVAGDVTGTAVLTADARLSDARTPLAHATSHKSAGSDAVKLDELAAPTDVTTLNATISAHGLMPKGTGSTATFYRSDMTQASVTVSVNIKQTEIDFGTTPVSEGTFVITDGDVSATSQLLATLAYEAPTGKDLDELEFDAFHLACAPGTGEFTLYVRPDGGYVADKFKINYLVG